MKDMHPLVVLSPREFNARTGMVIGLPLTTASHNETNPFAVTFIGPKGVANYILGHQPKSFDWRARNAKPHPLRQVPEESYLLACETLNQIMEIGSSTPSAEVIAAHNRLITKRSRPGAPINHR